MATSYHEKPFTDINLGLMQDLDSDSIPPGGWKYLNEFHYTNGRLESYPGWSAYGGSVDGTPNFGMELVKDDGTRYFVVATTSGLYYFNTEQEEFTPVDITGGWGTVPSQVRPIGAVLNNDLYIVNGTKVIKFTSPSSASVFTNTGQPASARFVINFAGHLTFGSTIEDGTEFRQRIRWSDFNDPTLWVPSDTNEANFYDFQEDSGAITGLALVGTNRMVVFQENSIHLVNYVGLPEIIYVQRVASFGAWAPYSIVVANNRCYFLGQHDFYVFDGASEPMPLGINRIRDTFFKEIDRTKRSLVYGFWHPEYHEIWWVYKRKTSQDADSCVVLNTDNHTWYRRDYLPFKVLGTMIQQTGSRSWSKLLTTGTTWADAAGVGWNEKRVEGGNLVLGIDAGGRSYVLGHSATADGIFLNGHAESGSLYFGTKPIRSNRFAFNMRSLDAYGHTIAKIGVKNTALGNFRWFNPAPLDSYPGNDYRTVANFFKFALYTTRRIALLGFSLFWQPAGDRFRTEPAGFEASVRTGRSPDTPTYDGSGEDNNGDGGGGGGGGSPTCTYTINPESSIVPYTGGTGSFQVITPSNCPWVASPTVGWLSTSASGLGSGTAGFSYEANSNPYMRSGAIQVAGKSHVVSQLAAPMAVFGRINWIVGQGDWVLLNEFYEGSWNITSYNYKTGSTVRTGDLEWKGAILEPPYLYLAGPFRIYNISSMNNPTLVAQTEIGVSHIVKVGNYVFAHPEGLGGLVCIDVSDKQNPTLLGGSTGSLPQCIGIFYHDGYVYALRHYAGWGGSHLYRYTAATTPVLDESFIYHTSHDCWHSTSNSYAVYYGEQSHVSQEEITIIDKTAIENRFQHYDDPSITGNAPAGRPSCNESVLVVPIVSQNKVAIYGLNPSNPANLTPINYMSTDYEPYSSAVVGQYIFAGSLHDPSPLYQYLLPTP